MNGRLFAIIALGGLLSCRRTSSTHEAPAASTPASASASAAIVDAGPADTELIWGSGLYVGVSSFVDNNRDLIEHIADHDPATAWNGNTGDLVGGWFGVRTGLDIYIHYVTFIVGFDKKTPTEDLFTANQRITRVRVDCTPGGDQGRDVKTLREVDVDPEVRTPQRVLVDASCWDLKLVVTGVKPGTHPGWRELTVSEFAVYGREKPPATPQVPYDRHPLFMVGSRYDTPKQASLYRGATYQEACAKVVADEIDDVKPVTCDPPTSTEPGHGKILETAQIPYSTREFHGTLAAFKTAGGVVIAYVRTSGRKLETYQGEEASKIDYRVKSRGWTGDGFVLDLAETESVSSPGELADHVVCHAASEPWCTMTSHRND